MVIRAEAAASQAGHRSGLTRDPDVRGESDRSDRRSYRCGLRLVEATAVERPSTTCPAVRRTLAGCIPSQVRLCPRTGEPPMVGNVPAVDGHRPRADEHVWREAAGSRIAKLHVAAVEVVLEVLSGEGEDWAEAMAGASKASAAAIMRRFDISDNPPEYGSRASNAGQLGLIPPDTIGRRCSPIGYAPISPGRRFRSGRPARCFCFEARGSTSNRFYGLVVAGAARTTILPVISWP